MGSTVNFDEKESNSGIVNSGHLPMS